MHLGSESAIFNMSIVYRLSPDGRHLCLDPAEQAALQTMRKLRQRGQTLRGIAAALNHGGDRTRGNILASLRAHDMGYHIEP